MSSSAFRDLFLLLTVSTGYLLALVVSLQLLWAVTRLVVLWFLPTPGLTRRVARALAEAVRSRRDAADALHALAVSLPLPWSRRVCRAGNAMRDGTGLVAALGAHHLIQPGVTSLGLAAEQLGQAPLLRWLDDLAAEPPGHARLGAVLVPAFAMLALGGLVFSFIAIFILPKFQQICMDLAVMPHPNLVRLEAIGEPRQFIPIVLLVMATCGGLWLLWAWREQRRRSAGGMLVAATAIGLPESSIARALGLPPDTDLPTLCARCGHRARDREDLLHRLAAEAADRERRAALLGTVIRVVVPLLLAVPVWFIATGVFGTLMAIVMAVGEAS
jgi:hypothetical protein